jgi:hypothetical protein
MTFISYFSLVMALISADVGYYTVVIQEKIGIYIKPHIGGNVSEKYTFFCERKEC